MYPAVLALLALPAAAPSPSDALFRSAGPVPLIRVSVDDPNLKMLRADDRKPVRARLQVEGGETLDDVALHLKGSVGSRQGWDAKPAITLNVDKFSKHRTFRGLDKFHLNNSAQDDTFFNELLANELAAAVGLPSCRCTHVLVELNGRKMGLYVLKEGFNKAWLKRHFAGANGNLYDGGFLQDIDRDLKLDSGTPNDRADLKALVTACRIGDREKRYAAVSKLIDVDRFISYAAFEVVTADWDGYHRKPNNYRVYFDPSAGGKAVFIPHGLDQMWQNPGDQTESGTGGMVAAAILDHPAGRKKFIARLGEVVKTQFTAEKMTRRVDELLPRVKAAYAKVDAGGAAGYEGRVAGLKERLRQRAAFLAREVPKMK